MPQPGRNGGGSPHCPARRPRRKIKVRRANTSGIPKRKFLIVGSGGREGAFALRLMEDTRLYAVMEHENPLIADCVRRSGGEYAVGDPNDPAVVVDFAKEHSIDYALVNADLPLANGVVDVLLENGLRTIGGTREAARIEWDKIYSIEMMRRVCPEFTPFYRVVSNAGELEEAVLEFESRGLGVVVKPQGLTGGKGVKVMPEHLPTYQDCVGYASSLLGKRRDEKVLLVERLRGIEFTIMGITDGVNLVMAPASYDYPFRYEGDAGPGTGGMGCFTDAGRRLPFMSDRDLDDCRSIMRRIIGEMRSMGLRFSGVLNGGFFKTGGGIRFMEFNARIGDPEALNIMSVLEGSFADLLERVWDETVSEDAVSFAKRASVVKYLVAKEYPDESRESTEFTLDEGAIAGLGVKTYFASCTRTGPGRYETLKRSRAVAFGAVSDTIVGASDLVNKAIMLHVSGGLEYRSDIGSRVNMKKLKDAAAGLKHL